MSLKPRGEEESSAPFAESWTLREANSSSAQGDVCLKERRVIEQSSHALLVTRQAESGIQYGGTNSLQDTTTVSQLANAITHQTL